MSDAVHHPDHYNLHPSGVECIDVVQHMGFCLGNAMKYVWRADLKGKAVEDLKKAIFYIEQEIKRRQMVTTTSAEKREKLCATPVGKNSDSRASETTR
jgi:hypothetical protein